MSVYKRPGATTYSYDFVRGGRRFSGSTGTADRRKAEAFEKVEKASAAAAYKAPRRVRPSMWFDSAAGRYWEEVAQHGASPEKVAAEIERLVHSVGPETPLPAITDELVARLVAARRQDFVKGDLKRGRISPAQVNRSTTQLLRRILTRAKLVWKVELPAEPHWRAHMLKEPRARVRELRLEEEGKLEAVEREEYRAPRLFAQITGLRRREVAGLTWDQEDFHGETISVVGKGDKPHVLPMTAELRELLEPLRGHHATAVFTYVAVKTTRRYNLVKGQRYPITYEGLGTHLGRTFKTAGLKGFRIHDLRHTAATRTLRATGNLRLVQQMLAHASPATTAKYAHATLDDMRAGMDKAAADSSARRERSLAKSAPAFPA